MKHEIRSVGADIDVVDDESELRFVLELRNGATGLQGPKRGICLGLPNRAENDSVHRSLFGMALGESHFFTGGSEVVGVV